MVGREKESEVIKSAISDDKSRFIAVYGRRRIGKTFLVRETCGYRFTFQHAGVYGGNYKEELFAFDASLKDAGLPVKKASKNWAEAFEGLKDLVRNSTEARKIVFIDELSWMDTPRTDLLRALENFWNGWASGRKDVVLIICASATSWMLSKVIRSKGGLYNRLTDKIHLNPMCLYECEMLTKTQGLNFTREQILQYYMVFGGIPYYWTFLTKGLSLSQNIDRILFAEDAVLKNEFEYLYAALFKHPEIYVSIVKALATRKAGMTRDELAAAISVCSSGDLTEKLDELESCGFIRKYRSFGFKSKHAVYQLIDNFTLFYYRFLRDPSADEHYWTNQINTPAINTWQGLAFERVCLLHINQIKNRLGILGVLTEVNSWQCKADTQKGLFGSQIDLLIVRRDQVINLCEIKYSGTDYTLSEHEAQKIKRRINDLKVATATSYAVYPTLITTYGLVDNSYSGDIQATILMDDLFVKL